MSYRAVGEALLLARQTQGPYEDHLTPQDMEELSWGRGVDKVKVGLGLSVPPHAAHHEGLPLFKADAIPLGDPKFLLPHLMLILVPN